MSNAKQAKQRILQNALWVALDISNRNLGFEYIVSTSLPVFMVYVLRLVIPI